MQVPGLRPLLLLLGGCAAAPEAPVLARVTPNWGWTGERTEVAVEGDHFYPAVELGRDDAVDSEFRLLLGDDGEVPLEGVSADGYDRLRATVPAGIAPGTYGLVVVTPTGGTASLVDAFEVRATRADRVDLLVTQAGWDIGEYAAIELQVVDPNGGLVVEPTAVEVLATSDLGAPGVYFAPGSLLEQQTVPGGVTGIVTATATLYVTSTVSDNVRFEASAEGLEGGSVLLSWEPGPLSRLEVELLDDDARVTAGVEVPVDVRAFDETGELITEDLPVEIGLSLPEGCGAPEPATLDLAAQGPYRVVFPTACESAVLSASALGIDAASTTPFVIEPGAPVAYAVDAAPAETVAGGLVTLAVAAVDAWGNVVTTYAHPGDLWVRDDVGGVDSVGGAGDVECNRFFGGIANCSLHPEVAAESVSLLVSGEDGLEGLAMGLRVEVGPPAAIEIVTEEGPFYAGEPFEMSLALVDAYGNPLAVDLGATPIRVEDDTGTLSCTLVGPGLDYECVFTLATTATYVRVEVGGVEGELGPMLVYNGGLAEVVVTGPSASVVAGEPFGLSLAGFDAYGNAYTEPRTGAEVALEEASGSLSVDVVALDAFGVVTLAPAITLAGEDVVIHALQAGVDLGGSAPFDVEAGPTASYQLDVPPYSDLADPGELVVTALDTYGNVARAHADAVAIGATMGWCTGTTLDAFVEGVARTTLVCSSSGLAESFRAVDQAGRGGTSSGVDILDFACPEGPEVSLSLDGGDSAVVCLTEGTASVAASAIGSTGSLHHFLDGEDIAFRGAALSRSLSWTTPGVRRVELVTTDTLGCAARTDAYAYVGEDDGSATGPVTVTVADAEVGSGGSTSVDVEALTCTGDVAARATLRVRADLGEPDGTPTGEGIELTLDDLGAASFDWDFPERYGGTATLYVGCPTGSALGLGEVEVTDELVRPMITTWTPAGMWTDQVTEITIGLTEPMLAESVSEASVRVAGPIGAVGLEAVLADDERTVVVTLDAPADAAAGPWTVLVMGVRDAAGNTVSGDWSGVASNWEGTFGDVADTRPTMSGVVASTATLTPDGDDGPDGEADSLALLPTASAAPAYWRLEVADEQGEVVRTRWSSGTETEVAWDARGDDGFVVGAGSYVWSLYAVDAAGNAASAGSGAVAVRHPLAVP